MNYDSNWHGKFTFPFYTYFYEHRKICSPKACGNYFPILLYFEVDIYLHLVTLVDDKSQKPRDFQVIPAALLPRSASQI